MWVGGWWWEGKEEGREGVVVVVEVCVWWWWWFGRAACMTCLSIPYSRVHLIRVAGHLQVRLPATPPPPPRPDGGQTLALCRCTGPTSTQSKLHAA